MPRINKNYERDAEIHRLKKAGNRNIDLAEKFNLHPSTIRQILLREPEKIFVEKKIFGRPRACTKNGLKIPEWAK